MLTEPSGMSRLAGLTLGRAPGGWGRKEIFCVFLDALHFFYFFLFYQAYVHLKKQKNKKTGQTRQQADAEIWGGGWGATLLGWAVRPRGGASTAPSRPRQPAPCPCCPRRAPWATCLARGLWLWLGHTLAEVCVLGVSLPSKIAGKPRAYCKPGGW